MPCGTTQKQEGFLILPNNVQKVKQSGAGTCPHGLPPGACPVCSTTGGGSRLSDRTRKVGEMTYHECAMIGNMMKARALAQKQHEANLKQHQINVQNFETVMAKMAQNISEFAKMMSKNFITKPVGFILRAAILPILAAVQNFPKLINIIKNLKFDITDKLNAIYGEAKAFLNKKAEEIIKNIKSGFEILMKIFRKNNTEDEDTKIDEDKKIFNLKTVLHKLKEKFKRKKNKDDERNTQNQ